jgi:hypothetical protein
VHATSLDLKFIQPPLDAAYQFALLSRPVNASDIVWKAP